MALPALALGLAGAGMLTSFFGSDTSRDEERGLGMYRDLARGRGPSFATQLATNQGNRAAATALGMSQAAPSSNPLLAQRNALQANATMQADIAAQAAALRQQEQLAAMNSYSAISAQQGGLQRQRMNALGQGLAGFSTGLTAFGGSPAPAGGAVAGLAGAGPQNQGGYGGPMPGTAPWEMRQTPYGMAPFVTRNPYGR
jgi:hypothetical protein